MTGCCFGLNTDGDAVPGVTAFFWGVPKSFAMSGSIIGTAFESAEAGLNGFVPPPVTTPTTPLAPEEENTDPDPNTASDSDKETVVQEVSNILEDQDFDAIDANTAIVADAQTGKVMTDVHGNRVRVDQYIFQPTSSSAAFLSLTSRTGSYQNGISAILFATQFNDVITGPLRDLPWNDYMNVVTREELTGAGVPGQYEQFIVHEHSSNGFSEEEVPFHPLFMTVVFTEAISPNTDLNSLGAIMFGESYTTPFVVASDQGTFWVQGVDTDFTAITKGANEFVLSVNSAGRPSEVFVNGQSGLNLISRPDGQSGQTAGFATDPHLNDLDTAAGLDFFRNSSVHPAFFEDQYGDSRMLYGIFLPIDDNGQVIDAPGFRLRGMRDLLYPNKLVAGGNYNLETIFAYGSVGDGNFQIGRAHV